MKNHNIDDLLERAFSGGPPGPAFRARVLLESTEALVRVRRDRARWRLAALSAAAVFIATASFFVGRCSAPVGEPPPTAGPIVAEAAETVAVSTELVAWLDAARLFRQLGMEDRMARAVDRAHSLLPSSIAPGGYALGPAMAAGGAADAVRTSGERVYVTDPYESAMNTNRIMALSVGD